MSFYAPLLKKALCRRLAACCFCAALQCAAWPAAVTAGFRENFEDPQTTWSFAVADADFRLQLHHRAQSLAHWGHGCEQLKVMAGHGTHIYFQHEIGRPRVHDELLPALWVKSDRPGVQLLARVVFPRAVDPQTGGPVTALVHGGIYRDVGAWQRLTIEGIPILASRQARVLRLQLKQDIDEREAYLDLLLVNLYCGPGAAEVLVDDLEIDGYVPAGQVRQEQGAANAGAAAARPADDNASFASHTWAASDSAAGGAAISIERQGSVLNVGGQPIFPRAIEHRGEAFDYLARLGFNTLWLHTPPTPWQMAEAQRCGLWLIAPPPDVQSGRSIGPGHDRVLAWDLGAKLGTRQLPQVRELTAAIRRADEQTARPFVASVSEQLRTYSRNLDVLLLDREPLGTACELNDYAAWITGRRQLMRPGTPVWTKVQTQPLSSLVQQWAGIHKELAAATSGNIERQQLSLQTYTALTSGARALVFASRERVDTDDEPSRQRAQCLELLNRELELIEPWLAICGQPVPIRTGEANIQATMFPTQRSHLIIATQLQPQSQFVSPALARQRLSLVVPGVPESSDAYLLTPTGLRPLQHRRVTGGCGVALDEMGAVAMIVFTSDPLVYARLAQTAARNRKRCAELQLGLATTTFHQTEKIFAPLIAARRVAAESPSSATLKKTTLIQARRAFDAGDAQAAYEYAQQAELQTLQRRRAAWQAMSATAASPLSHPALSSFESLPLAVGLTDFVPADRRTNYLPSGDMEDLDGMLRAGWKHFQRDVPGAASHVELSLAAPHGGRCALRLVAQPVTQSESGTPEHIESPPVWIRSAEVAVPQGTQFVIRGWVRVDQPLAGAAAALMIYDSHGGSELAQHVKHTQGWQAFALWRVAARDEPISVNFELDGWGEAQIDDLEVMLLDAPLPPPDASFDEPPSTARRLRDWFGPPR
jgi:hypothetical protein